MFVADSSSSSSFAAARYLYFFILSIPPDIRAHAPSLAISWPAQARHISTPRPIHLISPLHLARAADVVYPTSK